MVNKKINVHNKGLLVLVIISVAIGTLLAGISNYIPRSEDCSYGCEYGFPLQSRLQQPALGGCDGRVCTDYGDVFAENGKHIFYLKNFLINTAFYSVIVFITFGLVSATSLTIKKRNNANTRN